ncbi:mitochondrial carnitine-acylcarnitine carrier protein [Moesziomyces antarcticus T-34]|uniref:Mitochondrial carnitine-acylcarnitine carrier protein n=1 Tax=Pseudozyma antarctica (strain T-34) TaxID=1151754 RepID=M9LRN2_PSEA3|nr:mitochondrial carnitine-acylcarnitine carrier protein [Moesziomyces antarcticus T-34]
MGDSDDHGTASPRGKRMATTSMRGVPGSPTKKSASTASPTAAHATFSSTPVAAESPTVTAPDVRKHTKNKSSLVSGLRRLMGRREREARSAAPPLEISPPQQFADAPSADKVVSGGPDLAPSRFSDASATLRSRALSMDGAPSPGGLNLLGLADDAFGPDNALPRLRTHVEDSPSRSNGQDDNMRASPNLARRSPSLDLLRGFGGLSKVASPVYSAAGQAGSAADPASPRSRTKSIDGLARPLRDVLTHRPRRESTTRGASRTSVIEHISHEEARRLTGSAGPTILRTREAVEEHRSTHASFPSEIGLPDRAHFNLHQSGSPAPRSQVLEDATSMAEQSASQAATHAPSRPQRPHDRDALMAPPQDKPGQPSNGTGAGNSNRGGVSSSGSSFTSTSSAITDSAGAQRTPFSFQSQAYRPLSRDLRSDSKTMSGSPASASSLGFHLSGDLAGLGPGAFDSGRGLHRPSSSTGSQYALASARGGLPAQTASSMMPPPSLSSSDTAKRGHASRRSLNSLVGSKPWSSLLGSPHVGGGLALGSSSSHRKRVSTMAISRPMSVSTSAFSTDATDLSPDRLADLTLRPSDFEGARSRLRVDSTLSNFSEPSQWEPPSGPLGVALTPHAATAESSASSHHSHHSHRSHRSFQSHRLAPTSSNSALRQPTLGQASRPTTGEGFSLDHYSSPSLAAISAHLDDPPSLNRSSSLKGLSNVRTTDSSVFVPTLAAAAPISTRSTPRPLSSGSVLAHRKRPSFGLAIEPAAHSAFDSIPSPLLRTRRGSLALPDGSNSGRPFSSSSASAGRTTSDSSSRTSLIQSARASAGTLSSHHTFASDDKLEVETVRDGSPTKLPSDQPSPLRDDPVAELEIAMSAVLLRPPSSSHRHSVSVPMDEGDSPRQHQEESWSRATGATQGSRQPTTSRVFMIHSPNEEASASPSSGRLSQASKDIAFGSIAGMVSKVFEHPFDLVKVRLQTQSADRPPRYAGAFDCFKQTYLQEGIRGLYRGLSMPVLGATLENACLFFTYNQIQSAIRWANGEASMASAAQADAEAPLSMAQLGIAAAGAGSVTSLVLTPIELIKCKMQVQMITREQQAPLASSSSHAAGAATTGAQLQQQRSLYTSAVRSSAGGSQASAQAFKTLDGPLTLLRRTVATDGIRGLWLGQTGTLLRETGGGVAWFLAFEGCSRYLIARKRAQQRRNDITKKDLSSLELVGAGALAGISYNVVLFPADCVKSTMQTEQEMRAASHGAVAGQKWKGTGFFDTFKKIYTTRGVRGLYAGCGVTCLRSAPSSAIIFLMYNKLEKLSDSYGL